ncbi:hypothetical protein VQ045_21365 [Aurantimonas sp. E1-2-R+4]|uniref:hypothetical protein n=1 Tax=Aurantimonas sp. E1-2-R+4 TaxID=3113714 RepID=UPI002F92FC64
MADEYKHSDLGRAYWFYISAIPYGGRIILETIHDKINLITGELATTFEETSDYVSDAEPPRPPRTMWVFWFMDFRKCDAALIDLEELYPRMIERQGGSRRRADWLYRRQVVGMLVRYHTGKLQALLLLSLSWAGLPRIVEFIKAFTKA